MKSDKEDFLFSMTGITKRFPGVLALNDVNLSVKPGEVHALVGENGAGKSTLMNILGGVFEKDEGEIFIDGKKVEINNPHQSQKLGISFIHQELSLALNLNIAQNMFLGREPTRLGVLNWDEMYDRTNKILSDFNLDINPRTIVKDLGIATRQMVEIAKQVSTSSRIVVMDEPTSSLTKNEIKQLMSIIRNLRERGISVIYISHRLEEIFEIAARATVLRDGETVDTVKVDDVTKNDIVKMMVGRELDDMFIKKNKPQKEEALRIKNLSTPAKVKNINLTVHQGEILGLAGLVGSGRTELVRSIFGIDEKSSGEIYLSGKKVSIKSPQDAIRNGIGFVTEDRDEEGLVLGRDIFSNITLPKLDFLCNYGIIDFSRRKKIAEEYKEKLSIKTPSLKKLVKTLSGGNKQKVVFSKWLSIEPRIMFLDEPTRGIDVGAKKEIYQIVSNLAEEGMAIIFISSELKEVLEMCDRIAVLRNGEITGRVKTSNTNKEEIMSYATMGA